jgi:hypothetical protein
LEVEPATKIQHSREIHVSTTQYQRIFTFFGLSRSNPVLIVEMQQEIIEQETQAIAGREL